MRVLNTLLLCLPFCVSLVAQKASAKLEISHLSGDFYIFTTYMDYAGSPFPANGMYVLTDAGAVLFDTPWDTTQCQPLLDSIEAKHHKKVVMCISTHSHDDRTGGIPFFRAKGIKTYTTLKTDAISRLKLENRAEFLLENDTVFTLGQHRFQTCFAGPGHTSDNIVVWFEKERILYGGCLIKSVDATTMGFTGDANLAEWPNTINTLKKKFSKPAFIIPGHQSWTSKKALKHTLKLLKQYKNKQKH